MWTNLNFKGVLVEAAKDRFDLLSKAFSNNPDLILLNEFLNAKGENSIDNILLKLDNRFHNELGVLYIVIDSYYYYILKYLES